MGVLKLSWLEENESTLKVVYRSSELRQKSCGSYYPFGMAQEGVWQNYPNNPDDEFYPPVPGDQNDNFKYNGLETEDDLTGWIFYKFRAYDPSVGRFMSADPIADQFAHLSPYNYASNDPVKNVDLWGLQGVAGGYVLEGFRQLFEAAGKKIDRAYLSITTTTDKILNSAKTKLGLVEVKTTTSLSASSTTTVRTNFGDFFGPTYGNNEVTAPIYKVETNSSIALKVKNEVDATVRKVDINVSNTTKVNEDGDVTQTTEAVVGYEDNGVFVRNKSSESSSETDAGLKVKVKTGNSTITLRGGVTINF